MTPKQKRKADREPTYTEAECRALRRALEIERKARKLFEHKVRELLPPEAFSDLRRRFKVESSTNLS